MRCIGACQTELAIRMLDEILLPNFEVEFLVESKSLARPLHDCGVYVTSGDLRPMDTYVKGDLSPSTLLCRRKQPPKEPEEDPGGHLGRRRNAGVRAGRRHLAHAAARRGPES